MRISAHDSRSRIPLAMVHRGLGLIAIAAASLESQANLDVVTTTADLAALVQAVGGDRVKVKCPGQTDRGSSLCGSQTELHRPLESC
jgi:hypothetical protein